MEITKVLINKLKICTRKDPSPEKIHCIRHLHVCSRYTYFKKGLPGAAVNTMTERNCGH